MCAESEESVHFLVMATWFMVLLFHSLRSPVGQCSVSSFPLLSLDGVRILQLSMFSFGLPISLGCIF